MEIRIENVYYFVERIWGGSAWHNPPSSSPVSAASSSSSLSSNSPASRNKNFLLQDVNMVLKPGTLNVFMGTGQGHRILLECIALRSVQGYMSGNIQYNNTKRRSGTFRDIVYVSDMGSAHFDTLTVAQYLFYCE
jgi:ABC-type multidrug transport system ATPase subunit